LRWPCAYCWHGVDLCWSKSHVALLATATAKEEPDGGGDGGKAEYTADDAACDGTDVSGGAV
jgi:hypothetical protein